MGVKWAVLFGDGSAIVRRECFIQMSWIRNLKGVITRFTGRYYLIYGVSLFDLLGVIV